MENKEPMTPEERQSVMEKISTKMMDMTDMDLMAMATEHGIDMAMDKAMDLESPTMPGIVDTKVLTGPVNSLKNFLIKKSRDNDAK